MFMIEPFLHWLFGGFGDVYRDHNLDVHRRAGALEIYFKEIENLTAGKISLKLLVESDSVLDVGMGRGALGLLLRSLGMRGRIIGIDETQYDGETGYSCYDRKIFTPIQTVITEKHFTTEKFNYVVIFAPSEDVLNWVKTHQLSIPIKTSGLLIVATEHDVDNFDSYEHFEGSGGFKHYLLREF